MKKEDEYCKKCHAPFVWDMLTNGHHNDDLCVGRQLLQARAEIKKLKQSVLDWKEAWFHLRKIIGKLSWECHSPDHKGIQDVSVPQQS